MKKPCIKIIFGLMLTLIAGCRPGSSILKQTASDLKPVITSALEIPSSTFTETFKPHTPPLTKTPWLSPTTQSTSTWPPTSTPTVTPTPPDPEIVRRTLVNLFETNGGCDLPCWWGIIPGQTSWEEIEEKFIPITSDVWIDDHGKTRNLVFDASSLFSKLDFFGLGFDLDDQGIIQEISVGHWEWKPERYSISRIFSILGKPDEILIITSIKFLPQFQLTLYYWDSGIQIIYIGETVVKNNETTLVCPSKIYKFINPDIWIWTPGLYSDSADFNPPAYQYSIDEATNLSVSDFFWMYSDPEKATTCFEVSNEFIYE